MSMVAPTNDGGDEFIDLCVICRQGITRESLVYADKKAYHASCYAAFGQKQGNVKPS